MGAAGTARAKKDDEPIAGRSFLTSNARYAVAKGRAGASVIGHVIVEAFSGLPRRALPASGVALGMPAARRRRRGRGMRPPCFARTSIKSLYGHVKGAGTPVSSTLNII